MGRKIPGLIFEGNKVFEEEMMKESILDMGDSQCIVQQRKEAICKGNQGKLDGWTMECRKGSNV